MTRSNWVNCSWDYRKTDDMCVSLSFMRSRDDVHTSRYYLQLWQDLKDFFVLSFSWRRAMNFHINNKVTIYNKTRVVSRINIRILNVLINTFILCIWALIKKSVKSEHRPRCGARNSRPWWQHCRKQEGPIERMSRHDLNRLLADWSPITCELGHCASHWPHLLRGCAIKKWVYDVAQDECDELYL